MDELEISGKRYISTRRAGKEYKYHSDYIGQLVRAKKVVGQKVGRSWYVDEESLAAYFSGSPESVVKKESAPEPEKKVEAAAPVAVVSEVVEPAQTAAPVTEAEEIVESVPEPVVIVENKKEEVIVVEKTAPVQIEQKPVEISSASMHVPIRRASFEEPVKKRSLTYVEEEAAVIPEIKKAYKTARSTSPYIKNITAEEEPGSQESDEEQEVRSHSGALVPVFSVSIVGILVFAVVAMGSVALSSHTIIEAGKPASVGYTFR